MGWPRHYFSRVWGGLDNASRIKKEEEEEKKRGEERIEEFFSSILSSPLFFLLLPLFFIGDEGRRGSPSGRGETLNRKYRRCEIHVPSVSDTTPTSHKWRGLRRPRHLWDVDVVSDTDGHMYLTPTILSI